jgi:hypothetical protein
VSNWKESVVPGMGGRLLTSSRSSLKSPAIELESSGSWSSRETCAFGDDVGIKLKNRV